MQNSKQFLFFVRHFPVITPSVQAQWNSSKSLGCSFLSSITELLSTHLFILFQSNVCLTWLKPPHGQYPVSVCWWSRTSQLSGSIYLEMLSSHLWHNVSACQEGEGEVACTSWGNLAGLGWGIMRINSQWALSQWQLRQQRSHQETAQQL